MPMICKLGRILLLGHWSPQSLPPEPGSRGWAHHPHSTHCIRHSLGCGRASQRANPWALGQQLCRHSPRFGAGGGEAEQVGLIGSSHSSWPSTSPPRLLGAGLILCFPFTELIRQWTCSGSTCTRSLPCHQIIPSLITALTILSPDERLAQPSSSCTLNPHALF